MRKISLQTQEKKLSLGKYRIKMKRRKTILIQVARKTISKRKKGRKKDTMKKQNQKRLKKI